MGTAANRQYEAGDAAAAGYLLPADAGFEASDLPGLRKAAILIMGLGGDVAKSLLSGLHENDLQRLTDEITSLTSVPAAQLTQVLVSSTACLRRSSTWCAVVRSMRSGC